jgi:hypothetical protein
MKRRKFIFIDGTYGIDNTIKISKTEYYEGKKKRIHKFHGKSRTIMLQTSTRNERNQNIQSCFLQISISINAAGTLQVISV